jgi:hypothetical protein
MKEEVKDYISRYYPSGGSVLVQKRLLEVNIKVELKTINKYASQLNVKLATKWTEDEINFLKENINKLTNQQLSEALKERTLYSVKQKIRQLELKRTERIQRPKTIKKVKKENQKVKKEKVLSPKRRLINEIINTTGVRQETINTWFKDDRYNGCITCNDYLERNKQIKTEKNKKISEIRKIKFSIGEERQLKKERISNNIIKLSGAIKGYIATYKTEKGFSNNKTRALEIAKEMYYQRIK